jgi:hypothetical protein
MAESKSYQISCITFWNSYQRFYESAFWFMLKNEVPTVLVHTEEKTPFWQ